MPYFSDRKRFDNYKNISTLLFLAIGMFVETPSILSCKFSKLCQPGKGNHGSYHGTFERSLVAGKASGFSFLLTITTTHNYLFFLKQ